MPIPSGQACVQKSGIKKILLKFAIISYEKVNHIRKFQNAKIGIVWIILSRTGTSLVILMVEPPRARNARGGGLLLRKFGKLSRRGNLVMTSP